jgi:hypothetical protein
MVSGCFVRHTHLLRRLEEVQAVKARLQVVSLALALAPCHRTPRRATTRPKQVRRPEDCLHDLC